MNIDAIAAGVAAICEAITGVNGNVANKSGSFPADDTQSSISVRFFSSAGVGRDERRNAYDPDAVIVGDTFSGPGAPLGGVVQTLTGNRRVTLQIEVECGFQDVTAHFYAEQIRTGLRLPSKLAALNVLGLAVQSIGPSRDLPTSSENREISHVVFELTLNAADAMSDTPATTIETIDQTLNVTL